MLLYRVLPLFLVSGIVCNSAYRDTMGHDEEELSIQLNHPDVEDVVEAPPLAAMAQEAAQVDINSLPLLDWRTVKLKDFWFEVRGDVA